VKVAALIPARYASSRYPGKPLAELKGAGGKAKTLIQRTYEAAQRVRGLDSIHVVTDDERIAAAVAAFGGACEMTPADCASGTDRIAWAAARWRCDAVVNIQGDEPLIDPAGITRIARHLAERPEDPIVTLAADGLPGDLENPNVVKVVLDRAGAALYFSRAGIPYPRQAGAAPVHRHLGIYGYQRQALLDLARLAPTPLERSESLEQLRALENGVRIRVLTGARPSQGVDTAEDAAAAAALLADLTASGETS